MVQPTGRPVKTTLVLYMLYCNSDILKPIAKALIMRFSFCQHKWAWGERGSYGTLSWPVVNETGVKLINCGKKKKGLQVLWGKLNQWRMNDLHDSFILLQTSILIKQECNDIKPILPAK